MLRAARTASEVCRRHPKYPRNRNGVHIHVKSSSTLISPVYALGPGKRASCSRIFETDGSRVLGSIRNSSNAAAGLTLLPPLSNSNPEERVISAVESSPEPSPEPSPLVLLGQNGNKGKRPKKSPSPKEPEPNIQKIVENHTAICGIVDIYKQLDPQNERHQWGDLVLEFIPQNPRGMGRVWACEFTCPLTGMKFRSGTLLGMKNDALHNDGNIVYRKRQDAETACYARVLDSLVDALNIKSFKCDDEKVYGAEKLCSEVPLPLPLHQLESPSSSGLDMGGGAGKTISFVKEAPPLSPHHFVQETYKKINPAISSIPNPNSESVDVDGMCWWNSVFTCPLSGAKYHSGTFLPERNYDICLSLTSDTIEFNGMIYHKKKMNAEKACYARVFDSINSSPIAVEKGIVDVDGKTNLNSTMRYCVEEPLPFSVDKPIRTQGTVESSHVVESSLPEADEASRNLNHLLPFQETFAPSLDQGPSLDQVSPADNEVEDLSHMLPFQNTVEPSRVEESPPDMSHLLPFQTSVEPSRVTVSSVVNEPPDLQKINKPSHVGVSPTTKNERMKLTHLAQLYRKVRKGGNLPPLKRHLKSTEAPAELGPYAGWWTSTYACPLSEMTFHSGEYVKSKKHQIFGEDSVENVFVRNKVYYRKKENAESACIARVFDAINCSSYGKELHKNGPPRYCPEEPRPFQFVAPTNPTPTNLIPELLIAYGKLDPNFSDSDIGAIQNHLLKPNLSSTKDYVIDPNNGHSSTVWSSTFKCPVTGHKFYSGTFQQGGMVRSLNGIVYYGKKADAERACFAVVLDSLNFSFFKEEAEKNNYWQYCVEEPIALTRLTPGIDPNMNDDLSSSEVKNEDDRSKVLPMDEMMATIDKSQNDEKIQPKNLDEVDEDYPQGMDPIAVITKLHRMYNPKDLRASMLSSFITYSSTADSSGKLRFTAVFESPITNESFPSGKLRDKTSYQIDGKTYYAKKRLARDAAIGLAVDCFVHRNGWVSSGEERYQFPEDRMAGIESFCLDEKYNTLPGKDYEILVGEFNPPQKKENEEEQGMKPKDFINRSYSKLLKKPLPQDVYASHSIDIDIEGKPVTYWTSFFSCPVTDHVFDCGTLVNINDYIQESDPPPIQKVDDIICYINKNVALQAAAGKAFDALSATNFFSSFGVSDYQEAPGRFCIEDPFVSDIDDDEDEFAIHNVTETKSMEIVLDAWADLNKPDALSTALTWLEKLRSEVGDVIDSEPSQDTSLTSLRQTPITTFSCNAILKVLANKLSNEGVSQNEDIESVAQEIFQHMKALSRRENALPCAPDTETYTYLIRCLQSHPPGDRAKRAEEILNNMMPHGLDEESPYPSSEIFNAVMKHWLDVPGEESHERILDLFSKMEESSDIRHDRETFIIALKSLCKHHTRFQPEIATKWIERMDSQEKMQLDTEVFNAALPLIDDPIELKSRLKKIYSEDYAPTLDESHPSFLDAKNIEKWFICMDRDSAVDNTQVAPPNIETLDAVVQAWVKTGSEVGLARAESWAFNAASGQASSNVEISPRLETFLPILLGWAMANSKISSEKIESILKKMDDISDSAPHLKPDARLKSCLLDSLRTSQVNQCNAASEFTDVAKNATTYLFSLLEEAKTVSDLDDQAFETVLDMWSAAGAASSDAEEKQRIATEMLNVINSYNHFIGLKNVRYDTLVNKEETQVKEMRSPHPISNTRRRRSKCPSASDSLYVKFMSDPLFTDTESNEKMVRNHFHNIEGHLIRRDGYKSNKDEDGNDKLQPPIPFPEDMFQHTLKWCKIMSHPNRNGDAVRVAIRVLHSTIDYHRRGKVTPSQASHIYKEVIDVIQRVVTHPSEKRMITRRITSDIADSIKIDSTMRATLADAIPDEVDISDILERAATKKTYLRERTGFRRNRGRRGGRMDR